jgi:hypothetical protein
MLGCLEVVEWTIHSKLLALQVNRNVYGARVPFFMGAMEGLIDEKRRLLIGISNRNGGFSLPESDAP